MGVRSAVRLLVPKPVRRVGWRGLYYARDHWLKTIVSCQTSRKVVALTFDDGPSPEYTPTILEQLERFGVRATFFLLGRNVVAYPEIARQVARAGHALGNHAFSHRRLVGVSPRVVVSELARCRQAIRQAVGADCRVQVMRPPFGAQDPVAYLTARLTGYAIVAWSVDGRDWQSDPPARVAERVVAATEPGSIILLHDGWEPPAQQEWRPEYAQFQSRASTVEALPKIIGYLQSDGYEFLTLPEMIERGSLVSQSWFV